MYDEGKNTLNRLTCNQEQHTLQRWSPNTGISSKNNLSYLLSIPWTGRQAHLYPPLISNFSQKHYELWLCEAIVDLVSEQWNTKNIFFISR